MSAMFHPIWPVIGAVLIAAAWVIVAAWRNRGKQPPTTAPCTWTGDRRMSGVRFVDPALALDVVLTRDEAADVLLREYGAGPHTPDSILTAAARLTHGDTREASAAVAWLGIRFEDHQEDQ